MRLKRPKQIKPEACPNCGILFHVLCLNPGCEGHQNDRLGAWCRYCATHQRAVPLVSRAGAGLLLSSLGDLNDEG